MPLSDEGDGLEGMADNNPTRAFTEKLKISGYDAWRDKQCPEVVTNQVRPKPHISLNADGIEPEPTEEEKQLMLQIAQGNINPETINNEESQLTARTSASTATAALTAEL